VGAIDRYLAETGFRTGVDGKSHVHRQERVVDRRARQRRLD